MATMADTQSSLAVEVERIVTCPYPTQLQTLREILAKCDEVHVEAWATNNPQHASALVAAVLAALPTWPYCLDIVSSLATYHILRDMMLEHDPSLLSTIIDQAISAFTSDSGAVKAACSLLSAPLATPTPLPANAQTLLLRLFEAAAKRPEASLLYSLNDLLLGGCNPVIRVVPVEVLQAFEKHVFKILRETSDAEHQSLSLCCLSIMNTLLETAELRLEYQTWDRHAMKSFFTGSKAVKTLHLAVLQTLWFCSDDRNPAISSIFESTSVILNVISTIPPENKASWCHENAKILQKLFAKIMAEEFRDELKLMVFSVICSLLPPDYKFPVRAIKVFERLLLNIHTFRIRCDILGAILQRSICPFVPRLEDAFLTNYLESAHNALTISNISANELQRMAYVAKAMSAFSLQQVIHIYTEDCNDIRSVTSTAKTIVQASCYRPRELFNSALDAQRVRLSITLHCVLLGIVVHGARHGICCPSDLAQDILQINMAAHEVSAAKPRFKHGARHADAEAARHTPIVFRQGLAWQNCLEDTLQHRAQADTAAFSSVIHQICQELENRCHNVEAPLREQQTRLADLQQRYTELEEAYSQLESDLMDRDLQLVEAETQATTRTSELTAAEQQKEELLGRVQQAETRLREEMAMAHDRLRQAHSLQAANEVRFASENARLSEELEVARDLCRDQDTRIQTMVTELSSAKDASRGLSVDLQSLKEANARLISTNDDSAQELCSLRLQLRESKEAQNCLSRELDMQRNKGNEAFEQAEALTNDLHELQETTKRDKENFLAEYRDTAAEAQAEWEAIRGELEQHIESLESRQQEMEKSYQETSLTAEERCRHQQRQIAKLKKECAAKDVQLTSAQAMRNRLMTAMGIGAPAEEPEIVQSTLPIRSASSAETPKASPRRPSVADQDFESGMMDNSFVSADVDQCERTPKRTKPRRSFRVPTLHQPREASSRRPVRSRRSTSIVGARIPLSETSVNLSPTRKTPGKVTFKETQQGARMEADADFRLVEGWSFSTDVMTSTPGIGLGDYVDGDTTVDI